MREFDKIEATFRPKRTDDLRDGVAEVIGRRTIWSACWIIEKGQFEGDWAMQPMGREIVWPFGWVPLCDLTDVAAIIPPTKE